MLRTVFDLYIGGLGAKAVARELNRRGLRYRAAGMWSKDRVLTVVSEPTAIGTYQWGKRDHRTWRAHPRDQWIAIPVEPVVDADLFAMAQRVRAQRDPEKNPGRTGSSPALLAGLVRCGRCAAAYRLETSGKLDVRGEYPYRYYNCGAALRVGAEKCRGHRFATKALDRAVLDHVADAIFSEERCRDLLRALVDAGSDLHRQARERRQQLATELESVETDLARWYAAIEAGADLATLSTDRLRELESRREELVVALERAQVPVTPPAYLYTAATIRSFQTRLGTRLASGDAVARNYLRFLVEQITVHGNRIEVRVRGEAAAHIVSHGADGTDLPVYQGGPVHTSVSEWLPSVTGRMNAASEFVMTETQRKGAKERAAEGPSRMQAVLAQAADWAAQLASGAVATQRELARRGLVTPARVTQVLALTKLEPRLLAFLRSEGAPATERSLRELTGVPQARQLDVARERFPQFESWLARGSASEARPVH